MAQRRMFSPDIVESEEFLDMPHSSQSLYFHLAMRADDDGFIQPKMVMKMIGSNQDDIKVLLIKRFLLSFESGVIVIKHWLIHNMIRKDRYKETRFILEKNSLKIKENNAYTEKDKLLATKWQPNGNQMAPQVRLGKVSKEYAGTSPANPSFKNIVDFYFQEIESRYSEKPEFGKSDGQRLKQILLKYSEEKIKDMILFYLDGQKVKEHGFSLKVVLSGDSINKYIQNG